MPKTKKEFLHDYTEGAIFMVAEFLRIHDDGGRALPLLKAIGPPNHIITHASLRDLTEIIQYRALERYLTKKDS